LNPNAVTEDGKGFQEIETFLFFIPSRHARDTNYLINIKLRGFKIRYFNSKLHKKSIDSIEF